MSQIIILDTHIWFWWISQDLERFPSHLQESIATAERVGVSAISCYEIALAQQKGRIELPCSTNEWFRDALEPSGIALFDITPDITCRAVDLSPIHRDPFDRLIIATALEYEAKLASVDGVFVRYPELEPYLLT